VKHRVLRTFAAGLALLAAVCLAGCAGYRAGNQLLFRSDIRTVYVPVFESDLYRRNLGELLTEAVIKEIEQRTPYKVVHSPGADSVLYGRILTDGKGVFAEDQFDVPRAIEYSMVVEVRWVDRLGNAVMRSAVIPVDLSVAAAEDFIPEAGQSVASVQVEVVRELAQQIVGQMEAGW